MPEIVHNLQTEPDPFFNHPLAALFLQHALEARESTGSSAIPSQRIKEISGIFGLEHGEAAALAYLAQHRVDEIPDFEYQLAQDLEVLSSGETR